MDTSIIKSSDYIAALRTELSDAGLAKRTAALINQRALFPHRGQATLTTDELTFSDWNERGSITIAPASIRRITRQFDHDYGAFVGGASSDWGAPIIIELNDGSALYVLFHHRAFLEKTDNVAWESTLLKWLG